jgi:uncharacterized protein
MANRRDQADLLISRGRCSESKAGGRALAMRIVMALTLGSLSSTATQPVVHASDAPICPASDPSEAYMLGEAYDRGIGAPQDFAVAAACYLAAAQAGDRAAQFNIGAMYDNGRGVPRDVAAAADWYRKAAEQADGRAAYALGLVYQEGDAVPVDRREALKWFRAAERLGVVAAKRKITALAGSLAQRKIGVLEPGLEEFRRGLASLAGEGEAQDNSVAFRWFSRGAQAGGDLAAYALADLYERGQGVERDDVMANTWYNVAVLRSPPGRLRATAEEGAARTIARLTPDQRNATQQETRSILETRARAPRNAEGSAGSSRP